MENNQFITQLKNATRTTHFMTIVRTLNNFNKQDRVKVIDDLLLEALENGDSEMINFLRKEQLR